MLEYQNTKTFLLKDTLQISLKTFFLKLKTQFHRDMLLMILMVKKLFEHFMKKNYKKTNQKFRIEEVIKKEETNCFGRR